MSIDTRQAIKKLQKYISKVNALLEKSYKEGADKKRELDTGIKNFLRTAFPDAEQRIDDYRRWVYPISVAVGGREESEEEKQEDYVSSLKAMKNHLVAYKEEFELKLASIKKSSKLDKIEEKTRMAKAEAERRTYIVDQKLSGATIELLTVLRTELKERNEFNQRIIELQKDVRDIKQMLADLSKALQSQDW